MSLGLQLIVLFIISFVVEVVYPRDEYPGGGAGLAVFFVGIILVLGRALAKRYDHVVREQERRRKEILVTTEGAKNRGGEMAEPDNPIASLSKCFVREDELLPSTYIPSMDGLLGGHPPDISELSPGVYVVRNCLFSIDYSDLRAAVECVQKFESVDAVIINYEGKYIDEHGNPVSAALQSAMIERYVAEKMDLKSIQDKDLLRYIPLRQRIVEGKAYPITPFSTTRTGSSSAEMEEATPSEFESTRVKIFLLRWFLMADIRSPETGQLYPGAQDPPPGMDELVGLSLDVDEPSPSIYVVKKHRSSIDYFDLVAAVRCMQQFESVSTVIINYEGEYIDEYGNAASATLQSVKIEREVAEKINLRNILEEDLLRHFPIRQRIVGNRMRPVAAFSKSETEPSLIQTEQLSPSEFESTIAKLLSKMGLDVEQTKISGDGGIDIFAEDRAPVRGGCYVVQCKRYAGKVGVPTVRELYGTMLHEGASKSVLITTGTFTREAQEFAKGKPVELIDGPELERLLEKYLPGEYEV